MRLSRAPLFRNTADDLIEILALACFLTFIALLAGLAFDRSADESEVASLSPRSPVPRAASGPDIRFKAKGGARAMPYASVWLWSPAALRTRQRIAAGTIFANSDALPPKLLERAVP
jgi:hypothetical protein